MNKSQKVIKWASEKRIRSFGGIKRDLKYATDEQVLTWIKRLSRRGLIRFEIEGRKIQFGLTQIAYYNRKHFVA